MASQLRIQHCCCHGIGLIPGLGTSTYCKCGPKKKFPGDLQKHAEHVYVCETVRLWDEQVMGSLGTWATAQLHCHQVTARAQ